MVVGWTATFYRKTKYFSDHSPIAWKSLSTTFSIKDLTGNNLRNENKIFSRWRECFEDLLNPVRATPTSTFNTIDFGKEEVFTLTKVAAAMRRLKFEKAAGECEIRPEMLKGLNGEVCWLTRVYQVVWKLAKTPKDWKTGVIIPKLQALVKSIQIIEEYHFVVFQKRCISSTLKGNAKKLSN